MQVTTHQLHIITIKSWTVMLIVQYFTVNLNSGLRHVDKLVLPTVCVGMNLVGESASNKFVIYP